MNKQTREKLKQIKQILDEFDRTHPNAKMDEYWSDEDKDEIKLCVKCKIFKLVTDFSVTHAVCKVCINVSRKTNPNRTEFLNRQRIKNKNYREKNKEKEKSRQDAWRKENKEKISTREKNYREKNKEKRTQNAKEYRLRNKERIRQYYIDNPDKKLAIVVRQRTREMLKTGKNYDILLACYSSFLRKWIEFHFEFNKNMTFTNHGEYWHLDHVLPVNTFDLTDEDHKKQCFHWSNLMPLEASANLSKHDNIDKNQIKEQNKRLKTFCKNNNIDIIQIKLPISN
jgi:hypothetical protein